jgi:hypothetical protein
MTTIRRIPTSKIDGNNSNSTDIGEIRPFGEVAFYIDESGPDDKLTLMMFDGERTHLKSKVLAAGVVYGSNADSGDGLNRDTIKLIPDAELHRDDGNFDNDQYLIIDPTEPDHIHIRAGGSMDNSTADLFLGGEKTNVRVSDTNDRVAITADAGEGGIKTWLFDGGGAVTLPNSGIITANFNGGPTAPVLTLRVDSPEEGAAQINLAVDNNSINVDNNGVGIGVGSNNWYLTSEGQLTFPDNTVQTTAWTGSDSQITNWDTAYGWGDHASASYATESYVTTAVSNLVDTAPTTLDTLNELAAALGDDANFATSVSTAIGLKANTADLATVATSGSYTDLTDKPTIPSLTGYATESYVTTAISGVTATSLGLGNVTNESKATMFSSPTFTGTVTLPIISEPLSALSSATGTVTHNLNTSSIFYHTSVAANFTANFTNVPVTTNRVISTTLIIVQGATAYIPNAVQIDGASTTIKWADGTTPTGSVNSVDVVAFSLINNSGTWTVIGALSKFA